MDEEFFFYLIMICLFGHVILARIVCWLIGRYSDLANELFFPSRDENSSLFLKIGNRILRARYWPILVWRREPDEMQEQPLLVSWLFFGVRLTAFLLPYVFIGLIIFLISHWRTA